MKCPACGKQSTEVRNSRRTQDGGRIWRRRHCDSCLLTFSTYETTALDALIVIKNGGKRTRYKSYKLFASIYDALSSAKRADRGDAATQAKNAIDRLEKVIILSKRESITTHEIIDLVLETLEQIDMSACYRYAAFSPYRGQKFGISA